MLKTVKESLFVGIVLASSAVGCTFLISFDDVPRAEEPIDDGTVDSGRRSSSSSSSSGDTSSSSSSSSASSASSSGTVEVFPPACDENFDLGTVGCGNYPRAECGDEPGLTGTELPASDLLECDATKQPQCLRHCPHGCVKMPNGFPDACDDCNGKADGTYCTSEFRNWPASNAVFLFECQGGNVVDKTNCSDMGQACKPMCTAGVAGSSCCE